MLQVIELPLLVVLSYNYLGNINSSSGVLKQLLSLTGKVGTHTFY